MSWLEAIGRFGRKYKGSAGFVAKQVVAAAVPGGAVIGEVIEQLLKVAGLKEQEAIQIAGEENQIAGEEKLERIGAMLEVCLGPLADVCNEVAALKDMPERVQHVVHLQLATHQAVRDGFGHLGLVFSRFDELDERNREILRQVGYTNDLVERLLLLIQRNLFKVEFASEAHIARIAPGELIQKLDNLEALLSEMRSGKAVHAMPGVRDMEREQPHSVSLQLLKAASSVLCHDVEEAEQTLKQAARLHPDDRSLGVLSRSVNHATVPARKPLFDRYLFAEYSGTGDHHEAEANIRLWRAEHDNLPVRVLRDNGTNFSRDALRECVLAELDDATENSQRVIFGFDHQYGWPCHLRQRAGLNGMSWRNAVTALNNGGYGAQSNGPRLDIPSRFCARFNNSLGGGAANWIFWCLVKHRAAKWGIPNVPPGLFRATGAPAPLYDTLNANPQLRFRLTEQKLRNQEADPLTALYLPFRSNPMPADAVGGQGPGSVGGQTICGLHHIALMLERPDVAWWPFDGLDISADAYNCKHVGVEIYPGIYPEKDWPTKDYIAQVHASGGPWPPATPAQRSSSEKDRDAWRSCRFIQHADRPQLPGRLPGVPDLQELLNLDARLRPEYDRNQIQVEGWIVGA